MKKQTKNTRTVSRSNALKTARAFKKTSRGRSSIVQDNASHGRTKKGKTAARYYTRQLVVPQKENDYRPHLIRRAGLVVTLVLALVIQFAGNAIQTGSVLGVTDIDTNQLLIDTNQERLKHGVAALKQNSQLNQAAELKAGDMFANQYWSHDSTAGVTPWHWFEEEGYHYTAAGENLARDFRSAGGVIEAWMASDEHRANILDGRYQDVGFAVKSGVLQGKDTTIIVALYGSLGSGMATIGSDEKGAVLATRDASLSFIGRLGIGLQSMTPAAIASLFIVMFTALIALIAHMYGHKLPKPVRQTWYRHHGAIKGGGMMVFAVMMVFMYGAGGSI